MIFETGSFGHLYKLWCIFIFVDTI